MSVSRSLVEERFRLFAELLVGRDQAIRDGGALIHEGKCEATGGDAYDLRYSRSLLD